MVARILNHPSVCPSVWFQTELAWWNFGSKTQLLVVYAKIPGGESSDSNKTNTKLWLDGLHISYLNAQYGQVIQWVDHCKIQNGVYHILSKQVNHHILYRSESSYSLPKSAIHISKNRIELWCFHHSPYTSAHFPLVNCSIFSPISSFWGQATAWYQAVVFNSTFSRFLEKWGFQPVVHRFHFFVIKIGITFRFWRWISFFNQSRSLVQLDLPASIRIVGLLGHIVPGVYQPTGYRDNWDL